MLHNPARMGTLWIHRVLPFLLILSGCHASPQEIRETHFIMGTMVSFLVVTDPSNEDAARKAIARAARVMQDIERQMTIYGEGDNSVKRLNRAPTHRPVPLEEEVDRLLARSLDIEEQSDGAFSPTLAQWNLLWGFSLPNPPKRPPSETDIARIGSQRILHCLHRAAPRRWMRESEACQVDLGGIAKGYALDVGMRTLRRAGFSSVIIDAGGDIRLSGSHAGRPWRIGIRDPRRPGEVIGALSLSGEYGIATSGDYERYFFFHGTRYHHILDPHTGKPARRYRSVTVIAPSAVEADAWSTALFVGGPSALPSHMRREWMILTIDRHGRIRGNDVIYRHLQLGKGRSMMPTLAEASAASTTNPTASEAPHAIPPHE